MYFWVYEVSSVWSRSINGRLLDPVADVACCLSTYMDLTDRMHMSAPRLNVRKIVFFHMTSDEDDLLYGSARAWTSRWTLVSGCLRAALSSALHAGPTPSERQEGKGARRLWFGRTQPRRRGCPAGTERDNATEGEAERCNTRSTFEISKYNSCNIRLKAVEILETSFWNTWKHTWKDLKTIATIRNIQIKHMQRMCETYVTSR
jgi:hypothetical protein